MTRASYIVERRPLPRKPTLEHLVQEALDMVAGATLEDRVKRLLADLEAACPGHDRPHVLRKVREAINQELGVRRPAPAPVVPIKAQRKAQADRLFKTVAP